MAHRTSFSGDRPPVHIEVERARSLAPGDAATTARHLAARKSRGKPFEKGNAASRGRQPILALLGVAIAIAIPEWRGVIARAGSLRRRRCSELAATFGYVSAGASAIVASAELALAASRIVYAKALETGDVELFAMASKLANDSRQHELAAFELASREAAARPATGRGAVLPPWLEEVPDQPTK